MGDQQKSLQCSDLGWLAGIIDGEGCITLGRQKRRKNHIQYEPKVDIANTDIRIINRAREVLQGLGVGSYTLTRKTSAGNEIYHLSCNGFKRCKRLIANILPFLVSFKRERAILVLEFIAWRESLPEKAPYGEKEAALYEAIKVLNAQSTVEILRDQKLDAAIAAMLESELHGDMQSRAEMSRPLIETEYTRGKQYYVKCEQCGEFFRIPPIRLQRNARWCSKECRRNFYQS